MNSTVLSVFETYPENLRAKLMVLRQLILDVANEIPDIGELEETLKWGQPSYLAKGGSTIRIDRVKSGGYAMYFICHTNLIELFRQMYADEFKFERDRAILFAESDDIPIGALKHCISLALTYHLSKKQKKRGC